MGKYRPAKLWKMYTVQPIYKNYNCDQVYDIDDVKNDNDDNYKYNNDNSYDNDNDDDHNDNYIVYLCQYYYHTINFFQTKNSTVSF